MDTSIIDIKTTVRGSVPRIAFGEIARAILGDEYELSLVICGDALARRMYNEHRKAADLESKHKGSAYASNILSFPLSKDEGEIFLNIRKAEREAKVIGISSKERIVHLFVHGCFHLKGFDHSDEMERQEQTILNKFESNRI